MEFQAYFDEWSRRPGETVRMAVSTAHRRVTASFVRLASGPGAKGERRSGAIDCPGVLDARFEGRMQQTAVGSYARLPLAPGAIGSVSTVHCWIWPTLPAREGVQTAWSFGDTALVISGGRLELRSGGDGVAALDRRLDARRWYSVAVTVGGGAVAIDSMRLDGFVAPRSAVEVAASLGLRADALLLSASGVDATGAPVEPFNGKIDSPRIFSRALSAGELDALHRGEDGNARPSAAWRLGRDFASRHVASAVEGGERGSLVNGVERGVTGRNWTGESDSFLEVPEQYCALQFHEDDMVDANWGYDLAFDLPPTLASGIYAVRLEAGGHADHFPLFVAAPANARAPVLYLAPTNTYMAYANEHLATLDYSSVMTHEMVLPADEEYLFQNREPGRSCYDLHSDGTPVRYSSRRRPIFALRPGYPNWLNGAYRHFSADMYIVEWLERVGLEYHVATDEDLEREGPTLLDRYAVVVTGSHPEYWTRSGRDILEAYLRRAGGRLMYLGGNGFYWVTSRDPERPWIIEVRRDNSGTRSWDAPHGERTHVFTNEAGGIWRNRGKAPNRLVGVGFDSEGWSKACGYRRLEASHVGPGAKFFAGVPEETVGDYGFILEGAVGDEVDRYDLALGTPEHTLWLATSTGLGDEYQLAIEDLTLMLPDQGGTQRPDMIRADMVLVPFDGGGAVFSVGSMTYCGALAWNGCDNGLARLTENILRACAASEPIY